MTGWAVRASWAGREAEAQWGDRGGGNGWLKREKNGPRLGGKLDGPAGRCADWAESEEKFFSD
jgi:hypothetical protein